MRLLKTENGHTEFIRLLKQKKEIVYLDDKLNMSQQCALTVKEASHVLGASSNSIASQLCQVMVLLCTALVQPYVEHSGVPQHKDIELLQCV